MEIPKVGQELYVYGSCSISHGSTDTDGGLATISKVKIDEKLPDDHYNKVFISFTDLPGHGYNYKYLLEKQEELKIQYAGKIAKPDPDIDTPWIQNGDIVNGEAWKDGDVW